MEDYNKIIESLGVKFLSAQNFKILQPVTIENFYNLGNTIILVHKGEISFGKEKEVVRPGEAFFVPGSRTTSITYGSGNQVTISNDDFVNRQDNFFEEISIENIDSVQGDTISIVTFDAKVFDSVSFFASLDIPPFIIKNEKINSLVTNILQENISELAGRARAVKLNTEYLVVEIVRFIISNRLFVEQLATNSTYFKDPRLIDIFSFIKENLEGDLSNKVLANVANVSEDYVGQYFKMLTGINPQDYIEYQRMEEAVNLLRTTKKSIRDIGKEVGYKDTAYFCRRFKMMFGIPAGKMRRRESLINI
jgi:AraC-like DNA-binding protein